MRGKRRGSRICCARPSGSHALTSLLVLVIAGFLLARDVYAQEQDKTCAGQDQPVSKPLTELGSATYVRMDGQPTSATGGLYPEGRNVRPPAHEAAGRAIAGEITPLDREGRPDPIGGRIVMISVGMSNTEAEFGAFLDRANADPDVNPRLVLVNGAQAGRTADRWVDPGAPTWGEVNRRLARLDLTPEQVQVAWVKQTRTKGGDFPAKALALQSDLEAIARNLKLRYPNIKIAYFSSRTRSYTYWRGLSPEPVAFETGFSVKWMIAKQIAGDPDLNFDPASGIVRAPYLAWGPYLWIDGSRPRSDGRIWLPVDLAEDCTHPSENGRTQVAEMLIKFFRSDATASGWFLAGASPATPSPFAPTTQARDQAVPERHPEPRATAAPVSSPTASSPAAAAGPRVETAEEPADWPSRTKYPSVSAVAALSAMALAVLAAVVGWLGSRRG